MGAATEKLQIRYRRAGADTAWSVPVTIEQGGSLIQKDMARGLVYNVQARAYGLGSLPSLWVDQPDLTVPYINQRVQPLNLNTLNTGGIRSAWLNLEITYAAVADSNGAAADISCTAATLQDAAENPSYAASSVTVGGTQGETSTFYLYYDDPNAAGGALPLHATDDYASLSVNPGRIWVGQVDVEFTEGSSGGGSSGGGGFGCVLATAWVIRRSADGSREFAYAGDVRVGDYLLLVSGRWGRVSHSEPQPAQCVRVHGTGGTLSCSTTAPLGKADGGSVLAPAADGCELDVMVNGKVTRDTVKKVDPIGLNWVQYITCENGFFWSGDTQEWLVSHHNLKPAL